MIRLNYSRMLLAIMVGAIVAVASPAGAQVLGTYRWRLEPYCNVVTLSVEQQGDSYVLTGFDDRCGASVRAAVTGTAYFNPDGTTGIGLTTIRPDGISTQDTVTIDGTTLSGTWTDTASGVGGDFTFDPSSDLGTPRPVINVATKTIVKRVDYTVPGGGGYAGGQAVQCPTGYRATGGGATGGVGLGVSVLISAPNSTARGLYNNPVDGDVPDAWYVYVRNDNAGTLDVHAYAVCVSP